MRMKINNIDKQKILEMHSKMRKTFLIEQDAEKKITGSVKDELQSLLDSGCVPFGTVVRMNSTNPRMEYAIKQESSKTPGKLRYLFIDKRLGISEGGKFTLLNDKWECAKKPVEPKKLNQSQLDILSDLKTTGDWSPEPVPSQYLIDNGAWESANLADENDPILGIKYANYFKSDYPKGYFVYRKKKVQQPMPGAAQKIEVTVESCRTAIDSLYNHMKNRNSYPLSNEQKNSYIKTAQLCAEPTNRNYYVTRFRLGNKLKEIASSYGIELNR